MIARILTIALNTYRESVRARILIGLAGVAFAVSLYSVVVGAYTLQHASRVVSDLGAASISLFAVVVTVVIAATSLQRELEQKTIFPILARPIHRAEYLVGKYAGTLLTIGVFVLANSGLVLMLCAILGDRNPFVTLGVAVGTIALTVLAGWKWKWVRTYGPIPWSAAFFVAGFFLCSVSPEERMVVVGSGLLSMLEVMIIAAVGTLFASFSTPFLSALMTFLLIVLGRNADALTRLPVKFFGQTLHDVGVGLSKVVPNLYIYVPPRPLLTGQLPDHPLSTYTAEAAVSSVGWAVVLLAAASFVFKKRDFL